MTQAERQALDAALAQHQMTPGGLLPALHALQDRLGYVPPSTVAELATAFGMSAAEVHGVISFYHDFRSAPPGRRVVKLCRAEACQAMGANGLVEHAQNRVGCKLGETSRSGAVTLQAVYCLGNCALAPAAMVDGKLHGKVTPVKLDELVGGSR